MQIETPAFQQGQPIPKKYTCSGEDVSPGLIFRSIPKGTKSFAIIVDDPDAPHGTFDHWLAWNIPGNTTSLKEGEKVPNQGINGFQEVRYRGPCPPPGKAHRYFFKLFALDTTLHLADGASKEELEKTMEGHILDRAELIGTFKR
jgi:Raf kinase inhibitor-like YbhB/YbcL family protein